MTKDELARMIDHTCLKATATNAEIEQLCHEACDYNFGLVMVNPCHIELAQRLISGSGVNVGTVIGFPLGAMTTTAKAFEIRDSLDRGANEIDMVISLQALLSGNEEYLLNEFNILAENCALSGAKSKIILETCYLTDAQIILASRLAVRAGIDFVKTSTGFGPAGATEHAVRLMKETIGDEAQVKAAGGIRSLQDALKMINAGATRLGTSSSIKIISEFQ